MTIEQQPVPHPSFEDRHGATWYHWKDTAVMPHVADMYTERKRLTDAELAAEYWAQHMEAVKAFDRAYPYGESEELDAENERILTVERITTQPHAHESNYQ